ncbi:Bgt-4457 [Blumeria graminis f. sp. tritici]|uniref:Hydroxymethylglutaryl-CoA synthase n=2 Tax=Blumeria graminis f. sp. tritici TaxID=62690 RepID=A0A061HJJ3_BLUGR|nr:3-hydroxy-3-methylglutaryl-CoA (HMG-CoA) synthase [Blumeria graminis f. sp. tritici 96224]VDB89702.1 Bgt-4457 [Blumeria graminis f. sp. tritici]
MLDRPQNIGIKAIEIYFPSQCVEQSELEIFDGVSQGKYTIGLGQTKMSFCDDREDIYSFALTACSNLLSKYNINTHSIGRLEVGTETLLDKSKSVKSVLMQLFGDNTNIEGVDTINACYGGTNAVFNTLNWIESSAWDGRDAIVVTGDIALYAKGNARPTGGAGAVALLIGPNAPLVVEPGLRGSYMQHAYDFYKPDLTSEYPIVDGHFSVRCYTEAVDACYKAYNKREVTLKALLTGHTNCHAATETHPANSSTPLDRFDYMVFHAPTCKLVAKSYARLLYNDFLVNPTAEAFAGVNAELKDMEYINSLTDKLVEKTFMGLTQKRFNERVLPSIEVPTMCGNMYTASVYSGLASLLSNIDSCDLQGKRIGVFSYGSGLASSMFSLKVVGSTETLQKTLCLKERLAARQTVAPVVYEEMCELRRKAHLQKNYTPSGNVNTIAKGVFFLSHVDEMFRRKYEIKA